MQNRSMTPQWREILCPVDFSDRSRKALDLAVALTQRDDARLSVIHIVTPVPAPVEAGAPTTMPTISSVADAKNLEKQIRRNHEQQLDEWVKEYVPDEVQTRQQVLSGRPADELAAFAEEEGIDLIVLATLGHGRWQRFLFGSVAERLIRLSRCAVLILPIE